MSSLRDKKSCRTEASDGLAAVIAQPPDVVVGRLAGIGEGGAPLVDFAGNPAGVPMLALATARFDHVQIGRPVALMFLAGDLARPLAIGVVAEPDPGKTGAYATAQIPETLTLTAEREIVLQCGRASIVLTGAGKLLARGTYLSLRSSGMHRITGASVQIN